MAIKLATIEEIKAKLREKEQNKGQNAPRVKSEDHLTYPHWKAGPGTTIPIRLLPDADTTNVLPWVEKQIIRLPFNGVVGGEYPTNKQAFVTVPCIDMYEDKNLSCPIIAATKHLWKDKTDTAAIELARTYYKSRSYLAQSFILPWTQGTAFIEENLTENPIRRNTFTAEIYKCIKNNLGELETNPTDYVEGIDFNIKITSKGQYNDYSQSSFARKTRSLTDTEMAAIEKFGLFDLKSWLPPKPDADGIQIIKELFELSLAGEAYDYDRYGKYYRAYTSKNDHAEAIGTTTSYAKPSTSSLVGTSSKVEEKAPEKVADEPTAQVSDAAPVNDILARIKAKTMAAAKK